MLSDLPIEALKEGAVRYAKTRNFFPKIAELREAAAEVRRETFTRLALPEREYVALDKPPELSAEMKAYLQQLISRKPRHLHEESGEIPEMTDKEIAARRAELKRQAAVIVAREEAERGKE